MIILERMLMLQLTENGPQSGEFRESIINELVNEHYLNAIVRSVHYEKFLTIFEMIFNWKFIDDDAKNRIREKVNKILEFKISAKRKYADFVN